MMNILYISKLSGNLWAGPNNSIPAQIYAQSRYDNVFWYNINENKRAEWETDVVVCKNLIDYPSARLVDLPAPFCYPDLVIIEGIYQYFLCRLISDIQKAGIPYIIIPRSAMTYKAVHSKYLKKQICNVIWFNKMVRLAAGVQYLSEEERVDSEQVWNVKSFIIPNGIRTKELPPKQYLHKNLKACYVGRVEIEQKGLDMLIEAIALIKDNLRNNGFTLNIYGPDIGNAVSILQKKINKLNISDIINFHGPIFGKDKEKVLLDADVFIMTSRFEGLPMGLLEALSYGLPSVVTYGTNMAQVIQQFNAGWTAQNNVDSIAKAINKMIIDRKTLDSRSINARELSKTYSWDSIALRSHIIYQKIVNDRRSNEKSN